MRGFWKRPVNRTYSYNLNLGEHYYSPMTSYLETERGTRGEGPGALTYSERLARKWVSGRKYEATELRDRYSRARSVARSDMVSASQAEASAEESAGYLATEMARRNARATSEIRTSSTAMSRTQIQKQLRQEQQAKTEMQMSARQEIAARQESSRRESVRKEKMEATSAQLTQSSTASKKVQIRDDICKKIADVRMMPWDGKYLNH